MKSISRVLDLPKLLQQRSGFLLGPRQTGKSWLIRHSLPQARLYNLLDHGTYVRLSHDPSRLGQECQALTDEHPIVVVDEVQRLPELLNEVHRLIEERGIRFLLTGSSARKLRGGGVNLLGGRARTHRLHPFVSAELGGDFDLARAINHGLLPPIYFSTEPDDDLAAYAGAYLHEEVAAAALTRNVPAFSRFLQVAALCNGQMLNYSRIANDAQVARSTVVEYFAILHDTLLGYELPVWGAGCKRKTVSASKFYFFDTGVTRQLQGRSSIHAGTPEYGAALEALIFHELRSWCDYSRLSDGALTYWRSTTGNEVDFLLADATAIEVKATGRFANSDLRGLRALREEGHFKAFVCITQEPEPMQVDGISILPVKMFLEQLWAGQFMP